MFEKFGRRVSARSIMGRTLNSTSFKGRGVERKQFQHGLVAGHYENIGNRSERRLLVESETLAESTLIILCAFMRLGENAVEIQ